MQNNDQHLNDLPDDNIPALEIKSRNKSTKKLVAALVVVLIAVFTVIYIKTPRELKKSEKKEDNNSTSNMAPFPTYTPPPAAPLPPEAKPFEKVMGVEKKKELTRADRIAMPGLGFGSGSSKGGSDAKPVEPVQYDAQGFPVQPKESEESELGKSLKPTKLEMVQATILPNRDYLLTRGTGFDCDVQGAIDNRMPGFLTCIVARDVYSESGNVVLLPRGTEIDGEARGAGSAQPGQVRIAALFNRVKTPEGIVADIDSPAADSLGRAGIEGDIDYHFWQRFSSALLVSFFDTTWNIAANRLIPSNGEGTTNYFGGSGFGGGSGKSIVDSILNQEARIRPSIYSNQSSKIQITLARDVDFSSVVRLKVKP